MKKLTILLFLLTGSLLSYSQVNWIDIAITENEEIYVDTNSIELKDGLIYATIKTVYTSSYAKQEYTGRIKKAFGKKADEKIRKWDNFSYNISNRIYDCQNKSYKTLQIEDYRSNNSRIVKTKSDKNKATWIPVDIDTVADHVLFYLCDNESR